jgi:hypothetical protein
MAHDHAHDDPKTYYVEQLCTIGICGALGGIAVMLYVRGLLWFLVPKIQYWVIGGGVALLVLVAIRALVVWVQAGRTAEPAHDHHHHDHNHDHEQCHDHGHGAACGHDHDHDHAHGHGHGHGHSHGGDHGHDHGWAPWRYVILLLPVVLYFLNLPNESMAQASTRDNVEGAADLNLKNVEAQDAGKVFAVSFQELERTPYTPEGRKYYEGKTVRLKGQYLPISERMFTLVRYKMSCCAADAVSLKAIIMLDPSTKEPLPAGLQGKWLEVEGQIQFQQMPDRPDTWVTVIVLRPDYEHPIGELVKVVKPDTSYYLY